VIWAKFIPNYWCPGEIEFPSHSNIYKSANPLALDYSVEWHRFIGSLSFQVLFAEETCKNRNSFSRNIFWGAYKCYHPIAMFTIP
jgi:hypothetical protein